MKKKKNWMLLVSLVLLVLVLTGCGTGEISQNSTGVWDRYIVYYFAQAIKGLSFGNAGIGIILFTIVIRVILLPLMHFQNKSMRKTQDLQPQMKALQEKYSAKDPDTKRQLQEAQQRLYSENNVNPFLGCLPLIVQLPILTALYQAISRDPELTKGTFLWLQLGEKDPYFILAILAAVFTFMSTYLNSMSQIEVNPTMKMMNYIFPVMIFIMGLSVASGLTLYWVVSNAFQVFQTMLINNPFKIRKEREAVEAAKREREKALKKAMNPKKKRLKR